MKKSIALVAATTLALSSLSFNATAEEQKSSCWGATAGGAAVGFSVGVGAAEVAIAAGSSIALCGPLAPYCFVGAVAIGGGLIGLGVGKVIDDEICDK